MGNVQLSQMLHGICNVIGDLRHRLHIQPCFEQLDHRLHQHGLPVLKAEMVRASCQEAYDVVAALWGALYAG